MSRHDLRKCKQIRAITIHTHLEEPYGEHIPGKTKWDQGWVGGVGGGGGAWQGNLNVAEGLEIRICHFTQRIPRRFQCQPEA